LLDAALETGPVVLFEAPHRVTDALEDIAAVFGDRPLVVGRELTKLHEEVFRGTAASALAHFSAPRGEFVIAVEGAPERAEEVSDAGIEAAIARLKASGLGGRTLVDRATAETGAPRSRVYRLFLRGE
jgi:16S rRNA (cytidine1402-2'-O)-methyltransferase